MIQVNSTRRGIVLALSAFTIWVLSNTFTKFVAEASVPPYEVVAFMGSVGALIVGIKTIRTQSLMSLWPTNPRNQFFLASLYLLADACNVVAFRHLSLPVFYTVVFIAPMIIALSAALLLKEPLPLYKIIAILLGFCGVLIAVHPWDGLSQNDTIGYLAGLGTASFWALSVIVTRKLSSSESIDSMVFNNGLVQAIGGGLLLLIFGGAIPLNPYLILMLTIAGIFQISGVFCFYLACKYAAASTIAPYHYSQIISGAIVSALVFHTLPTWYTALGALVIIITGVLIARNTEKN